MLWNYQQTGDVQTVAGRIGVGVNDPGLPDPVARGLKFFSINFPDDSTRGIPENAF